MMHANGARFLSRVLFILAIFAIAGIAALYISVLDPAGRKTFELEIGKGLVQILTVAVLGSIVKLLIDDHQRRLREATEAQVRGQQAATDKRVRDEQAATDERVRAEQYEERLEAFRTDKVRRLVGVTNVLRRAPALIDAHRSANTYNQHMREILNAGLELRLIRHESDALGSDSNRAFHDWPQIRAAIRTMEAYIAWIVSDFRRHSKELSELQRKAEQDRTLQITVWNKIREIPTVQDLLQEIDAAGQETRYAAEYLDAHERVLRLMIVSSLRGSIALSNERAVGAETRI